MHNSTGDPLVALAASRPESKVITGIDPTMKEQRQNELSFKILAESVSDKEFRSSNEANEFMSEVNKKIRDSASLIGHLRPSPSNQAFELVFQAWKSSDSHAKIELAREALRMDRNCVDAFILLAEEEASSIGAKCAVYQRAVAAGEQELGSDSFKYNTGKFWQLIETRPYLRAKAGLAEALLELGNEADAIEHFKDILKLNPRDNQAIRYRLLDLLLTRKEEKLFLSLLFARFSEDCMAHYLYHRALWLYSLNRSSEANMALKNAFVRNSFVPVYLLDLKELPQLTPTWMALGSPEEAVSYVRLSGKNWNIIPGAKSWLARKVGKPTKTHVDAAMQFEEPDSPRVIMDTSILLPVSIIV